mgnify:CR=1 FL=1
MSLTCEIIIHRGWPIFISDIDRFMHPVHDEVLRLAASMLQSLWCGGHVYVLFGSRSRESGDMGRTNALLRGLLKLPTLSYPYYLHYIWNIVS